MDALIIGAGAAGLAAADRLLRAGRTVAVLEARDRVGGRIYTRTDPAVPYPVELGGEFLHGPPSRTWEILSAARAALFRGSGAIVEARGGRLEVRPEQLERTGDLLRALSGEALSREALSRDAPEDRSLSEALAAAPPALRRSAARTGLLRYVRGYHAADPERVSLRWLREAGESGPSSDDLHAISGCARITDALGREVRAREALHLACVVRAIRWSRGAVACEARMASGRTAIFRARRAIVTVPLGVLQAGPEAEGALRFEPELPEKRRWTSLLGNGQVRKVVLRIRERTWEREGLEDVKFVFSPGLFPTFWTQHPVRAPLLVAWCGGPPAARLAGRSPEAVTALALRSLARALGAAPGSIEEQLEAVYTHDWSTDPFARGAYSYVLAGGIDAPAGLARPVEDTLFFAGEATVGGGRNATVEGAISSGERAAAEILRGV